MGIVYQRYNCQFGPTYKAWSWSTWVKAKKVNRTKNPA